MEFITGVFINLILQIIISYLSLLYFEKQRIFITNTEFVGALILSIILIISIFLIKSITTKFLLFCSLSIIVGLLLTNRIDKNNEEEVKMAEKSAIISIELFLAMIIYALFLYLIKFKFPSIFGIYLFIFLVIITITIFIISIKNKYEMYYKQFAYIIIYIFGVFIVYDTLNILYEKNIKELNNDFILASLDYFLDILNVFAACQSILSSAIMSVGFKKHLKHRLWRFGTINIFITIYKTFESWWRK